MPGGCHSGECMVRPALWASSPSCRPPRRPPPHLASPRPAPPRPAPTCGRLTPMRSELLEICVCACRAVWSPVQGLRVRRAPSRTGRLQARLRLAPAPAALPRPGRQPPNTRRAGRGGSVRASWLAVSRRARQSLHRPHAFPSPRLFAVQRLLAPTPWPRHPLPWPTRTVPDHAVPVAGQSEHPGCVARLGDPTERTRLLRYAPRRLNCAGPRAASRGGGNVRRRRWGRRQVAPTAVACRGARRTLAAGSSLFVLLRCACQRTLRRLQLPLLRLCTCQGPWQSSLTDSCPLPAHDRPPVCLPAPPPFSQARVTTPTACCCMASKHLPAQSSCFLGAPDLVCSLTCPCPRPATSPSGLTARGSGAWHPQHCHGGWACAPLTHACTQARTAAHLGKLPFTCYTRATPVVCPCHARSGRRSILPGSAARWGAMTAMLAASPTSFAGARLRKGPATPH